MNGEGDIWVWFYAANVGLIMILHCYLLDEPLLVRGRVINSVRRVDVHHKVHFEPAVRPRNEHEVALLVVERKEANVERAIGFRHGRKHPENVAVVAYDRVRVHEVVKTVVGAVINRE